MSVWNSGSASGGGASSKVTIPSLVAQKAQGHKISAVTAYDVSAGRLADEAGLDVVLVGDSLAMTMLGHENTLSVTMDEMLMLTRAVRRGVKRALLVADMPYGSYQMDEGDGVKNALRFIKEAGAEAVKLEGGRARAELVRRLVEAEIPVMGHIGLTPQAVNRMGGYKVQARTQEAVEKIQEDAHLLSGAGCFAVVLEGIPREVAAQLTAELTVPTIGIGAGPECDGQILVWHDLLGINAGGAKFVRRFAEVGSVVREALEQYRVEVEAGTFPNDAESYHLPRAVRPLAGAF